MPRGIKLKKLISLFICMLLAVTTGINNLHSSAAEPDAKTLENMKAMYSVLHCYGFTDEWIAGIMSNWAHESGNNDYPRIDAFESCYCSCPSCPNKTHVYYSECSFVKSIADPKNIKKLNDYTLSIGHSGGGYYDSVSNSNLCGLGVGQLTGPRSYNVIKWTSDRKLNWYDTKAQLAFILQENVANFTGMAKSAEGKKMSATEACIWFSDNWEGIAGYRGVHSIALNSLYKMIKDGKWSEKCYDEEYAKDIEAIVKSKAGDDCSKYTSTKFNSSGSSKSSKSKKSTSEDSNENSNNAQTEWDLVGMPAKCILGDKSAVPTMADVDDWNKTDIYNMAKIGESIQDDKEFKVIDTARTIIVFVGLLLMVYAILLLIALMFDKTNSFFDLSLLSILTFGTVKYTDDAEQVGRDGYVRAKKVVTFIIVISTVGILLISGGIFPLLFKGIQAVYSLFSGG